MASTIAMRRVRAATQVGRGVVTKGVTAKATFTVIRREADTPRRAPQQRGMIRDPTSPELWVRGWEGLVPQEEVPWLDKEGKLTVGLGALGEGEFPWHWRTQFIMHRGGSYGPSATASEDRPGPDVPDR
jgi:hypothetical protein